MSDEANGLNGLMSGGLAFIAMIVGLLGVVWIADLLKMNLSSASADTWLLFIVLFLLRLWYKDVKRER